MNMRRFLLAVCAAVLPAAAQAHDFWLEPSAFKPAAGETVTITLRVGEHFAGDPIPRRNARINTFTAHDSLGERPVPGRDNRHPAGALRILSPGITTVVYTSKANPVELSAARVARFTSEEGLAIPRRVHAEQAGAGRTYHENFYRFAKLLLSGTAADEDRGHGLRFELVAQSNPWGSQPLRVLVLLDGRPLAGARVTAMHRDDPEAAIIARTDDSGVVALNTGRHGVWLIKSVHLAELPAGGEVDWETLWASLTFER